LTEYRVVPIPDAVAHEVRATRRSPGYGHPAHAEVAAGTGPCRSCLAPFRVGEERRILFTFDSFAGADPEPQPGPVFIHEETCAPHSGPGFPPGLAVLPLTLEAFAGERRMVRRERLGGRAPDGILRELLALPEVRYVNLRHAEAGCFIARAERLATSPAR
jgi:hypothetical protein